MTSAAVFHCPHLQPFVDGLLADGATIVRTETAWSNVLANLVLSQGPTVATARAAWLLPEGVEVWSNDDSHYDLENGLSCAHCKMSVSWPRPERLRGQKKSD